MKLSIIRQHADYVNLVEECLFCGYYKKMWKAKDPKKLEMISFDGGKCLLLCKGCIEKRIARLLGRESQVRT